MCAQASVFSFVAFSVSEELDLNRQELVLVPGARCGRGEVGLLPKRRGAFSTPCSCLVLGDSRPELPSDGDPAMFEEVWERVHAAKV